MGFQQGNEEYSLEVRRLQGVKLWLQELFHPTTPFIYPEGTSTVVVEEAPAAGRPGYPPSLVNPPTPIPTLQAPIDVVRGDLGAVNQRR